MSLREDTSGRGWVVANRPDSPPASHLLLDGGRFAVPDDHAGTFLNLYTNAVLRGERLYVVEIKTSAFRLFFDLDTHFSCVDQAAAMPAFIDEIRRRVAVYWSLPALPRMIVCAPDPKPLENGGVKCGFHVHFPDVIVNSPIALAFRAELLDDLHDYPLGSTNELQDVVDMAVFRSSGLRMLYSGKMDVYRDYRPIRDTSADLPETLGAAEKRAYIRATSVRCFDLALTPTANGNDKLADESVFAHSRHRVGSSARLGDYAAVLPVLQGLLPAEYATQRFVGVFKTEYSVFLKSSSRLCGNVGREHRTSNVFFCVSRRGMTQKCFCRKEDRGCVDFAGPNIPIPTEIADILFPAVDMVEDSVHTMPSTKSKTSLSKMLGRSRPITKKRCKK